MDITALIAAGLVVVFLISIKFLTKRERKGLNLPPGSYGWPLVGETIEFIRARSNGSPETFVRQRMDKYKTRVFKTSLLGEPVAVLSGPAANKLLFSNQNKVAFWWPASMKKILEECVITSAGVEGARMRKMIACFFTPDAFTKLYLRTVNTVAQQNIATHWEGKKELKVHTAARLYTFEVACRLFMSIQHPEHIKKLAALFKDCLDGVFSLPLDLPGTKFYKAKRAGNAIRKEIRVILRQRREALRRKTALPPPQDLLTHLLVTSDDHGKLMSESVIVNNVLLLLVAGDDTSSSAITLLIRSLALHPQVYENVLREQRKILASKKPGESLQWEDVQQKMKYSQSVVNETMRLWPSVGSFAREALVDITFDGYDIPKGWKLFSYISSTHTDPSLFSKSDEFDPSRFDAGGGGGGPAPYSFVPFGGGPRMCLGKEFARLVILTFLHNVIAKYRWELVNPDEKIMYDPIAAPEHGLPIRLYAHK